MDFIDPIILMQELRRGEKADSQKILAEVDRQAVKRALKKTKEGLPKKFSIRREPIDDEFYDKIPDHDQLKLDQIYATLPDSPQRLLPVLFNLRKKYPNVPTIYNYIATAYAYLNQKKKNYQMLIETVQKFPDYLFGKIALANYYLNHEQHKKVPAILNGKLEIYEHYPPTTKAFHFTEVQAFYAVVGMYHARVGNQARALFYYFMLEDLFPDDTVTRMLGNEIIYCEIKRLRRKLKRMK